MICDFCSSPSVAWRFPAVTFAAFDLVRSIGNWAACEECARLVNDNNRVALCYRSVDSFMEAFPDYNEATVASMIAELHVEFWDNRTGPGAHLWRVPFSEVLLLCGFDEFAQHLYNNHYWEAF